VWAPDAVIDDRLARYRERTVAAVTDQFENLEEPPRAGQKCHRH
jgi:hypothetical protein